MDRLTIRPLQWKRLRELREVAPLDAADLACMAELRDVLARHGRLQRFALQLVHKHFDISEREVLVEYTDVERREHRLRVEPRASALVRQSIPTTWMLERERAAVVCVCAFRQDQGHLGRHESA
jgi:hypothetical protein